jgi:hypothetical protein
VKQNRGSVQTNKSVAENPATTHFVEKVLERFKVVLLEYTRRLRRVSENTKFTEELLLGKTK